MLKLIAVTTEIKECIVSAKELADELQLELVDPNTINYRYLLTVTPSQIELCAHPSLKIKPIIVNFLSPQMLYRLKHGVGRQQLIGKAVGLKKFVKSPTVLDTTAGFGEDALILAALGCKVHMLERNPILGVLLRDGLQRARADPRFANYQIDLTITDAIDYMQQLRERLQLDQNHKMLSHLAAEEQPDIIYIDPMYPQRTKSALGKMQMTVLRDLVGEDPDAVELLQHTLAVTKRRIVVKQPRLARTLTEQKPYIVYKGRSIRYDVYVK